MFELGPPSIVYVDMEKLSTEDSFNVLVSLARQTKLTYQEHQAVDNAVNTVLEALKKNEESVAPTPVLKK